MLILLRDGFTSIMAAVALISIKQTRLVAAASEPSSHPLVAEKTLDLQFDEWTVRHGKSYKSKSELVQRRKVFMDNAFFVAQHNLDYAAGRTLYAMTLEDSPFSDLTDADFARLYLMDNQQNCSATHTSSGKLQNMLLDLDRSSSASLPQSDSLPKFVDWRTAGIMTPVKNQKHCGSCWTFSTTGTLEAHTCLHSSKMHHARSDFCTHWTGLAEQQLLDCATAFDNHGCRGGLPSHAFEYIKETGGLDSEESYHYRANSTDGHGCTATYNHPGGAHVAEVYNITALDEDDLVSAIAQVGPVSIAYQVSPDFRFYSHGVYDSWNATTNTTMCHSGPADVNHAVVAVGYGETEPTKKNPMPIPFYIVRNSWSSSWGMEGHFWMKRGSNLCGVAQCASFPIVPESPLLANYKKNKKIFGTRSSSLRASQE